MSNETEFMITVAASGVVIVFACVGMIRFVKEMWRYGRGGPR